MTNTSSGPAERSGFARGHKPAMRARRANAGYRGSRTSAAVVAVQLFGGNILRHEFLRVLTQIRFWSDRKCCQILHGKVQEVVPADVRFPPLPLIVRDVVKGV